LAEEEEKPKKKRKINWPEYNNESLVRRGEIMFDTGFLANWRAAELRKMNEGKEGAKYRYPNSLISLLATVHAYLIPYRQLVEGFLNIMSEHIDRLKVPDYTTIQWRVARVKVALNPMIDPGRDDVVKAVVDSTGIKVTNNRGGEWIRDKWKRRRGGFVKIHVAVDVKTRKILSMKVTKENISDGMMLKRLVKEAPAQVDKVLADGAYDSKDNFRFLDRAGIEPAIKVRKNASFHAHGCIPRKMVVVVEQLQDVKRWKKKHGYGMRWWMAESAFSSIKRMFGEHVTSQMEEHRK
jgi:hypothetical protein